MAPTYAHVAELAASGDIPITPRSEPGMLRHLDDASRQVESICGGRRFWPWSGTRTFDFPHPTGRGDSQRLWLDDDEVVTVASLTVAGTTWAPGEYRLQPSSGPPYRWVEPADGSGRSFAPGPGAQGAVSITGVFGYGADTAPVASLTGAVSSSATSLVVSDGSQIGAGQALRIGSEWLVVRSTGWVETVEVLADPLTIDHTDQAIMVDNGADFSAGEMLRIGTERMLVVDVIGDHLYVERSADGSYMAEHSAAVPIYARRSVTVARGQLGTAADSHADGAQVLGLVPPAMVRTATIGIAMMTIAQEAAAWARMVGSGESEREARGASLAKYLARLAHDYGQVGRVVAVGP